MTVSSEELRSQLNALLELQSIDIKISQVQGELAEIEEMLGCEELQDRLTAASDDLALADQQLIDLRRQAKYWEQESGVMRSESQALEKKMYGGEVSNLKELEKAEKRVVQLKEKADELEDQALLAFDEIEERERELAEKRAAVEQLKVEITDRDRELTGRREQAKEREQELTLQRADVEPVIKPDLLARYNVLRGKKAGVAIVAMRDNTCTGCRVSVPVILANRIRRFEEMIPCENCGRLLCWVE